MEEVEDEDAPSRYVKNFPTAAKEFGRSETLFETIFNDQESKGEMAWAPFNDKDDWELARWLAKNVTHISKPGIN